MLYVVSGWRCGSDDEEYGENFIVITTFDKTLADKVMEHDDFDITEYYTKDHTVPANIIDMIDVKAERDMYKKQLSERDRVIREQYLEIEKMKEDLKQ